jgi:uncharacterized protein YgiM (DUF1202 family)
MKLLFSALVACGLFSASAWAAPGTMLKDDELRAEARAGSALLGRIGKGASVEVLNRQGGWTQIAHAGKRGWVRILSLRMTVESGTNMLGGIAQMGGARRDPNRAVAVAGVRGLNEEALRSARFDAGELARLHQFASNRADAEQFARSAGLKRLDLAYIKAAKREQDKESGSNAFGEGGL